MAGRATIQAEIAARGKGDVPETVSKPRLPAPVGAVFTPRPWAVWLADRSGTTDAWLDGASILDPTCGRGDLLLGLLEGARRRGWSPSDWPIHRLYGIEREPNFLRDFVRQARNEFGIDWPRERLFANDLLLQPPEIRTDRLLGNPPWVNFAELPDDTKTRLKPEFARAGLVPDRRKLLLGSSRVDLAALVIVRSVEQHLKPGGAATFFLPLSLFANDGAHDGFRRFRAGDVPYALEWFADLTGSRVFPGVATRYGAAHFRRDAETHYPVRCFRDGRPAWAGPLSERDGPLAVADSVDGWDRLRNWPRVSIQPGIRPRQGVNPCGASRWYFLSDVRLLDGRLVEAVSPAVGRVLLPRRFVYPLLDRVQFDDPEAPPRRWLLLPHDPATGRPLTTAEVAEQPELAEYLALGRSALAGRRGRWLGAWIERGQWWALLGVGPYCFTPYRVAWPSYGADRLTPHVFGRWQGQPWQGRQALHAAIACSTRKEAERIAAALRAPAVEDYLRSFGTAATRGWAQPGRMARLLEPMG